MALGARARFLILRRDGFRCRYCGGTSAEARLHVDHVIPRAAGGSNDPENLVTACARCNIGKGAMLPAPMPADEVYELALIGLDAIVADSRRAAFEALARVFEPGPARA
jgi:hypothetical protein